METANIGTQEIQQPRRRSPVGRFIKWFFISIGSLVGLFVLFLLVVTLFFGNKVEQLFLDELNKQLATELTASKVSLSLFRGFPNASVTFHDIAIRENIPGSNSNLLEAKELSFRFNIFDILKGRYNIKRMEARDGELSLLTKRDGRVNWDIMKESTDSTGSETFNLDLQTVSLENMRVTYVDEGSDQDIALLVQGGRISGNFTETKTRLEGKLGVIAESIRIGEGEYFTAKPATLNLTLDADFEQGTYAFSRSHVAIEGDKYSLSGTVSSRDVDLTIEGEELSIASFLAVMPLQSETLQAFTSEGNLTFSATIKGNLEGGSPGVDVKFALEDGTISHPDLGKELKDVDLTGSFQLGENADWNKARLELDLFRGEVDGQPFDCTVLVTNLNNPALTIALNATFDLHDWNGVIATDALKDFEGSVTCEDVHLTATFGESGLSNISSSGTLGAYDVGFAYLNKTVSALNSSLDLANNQLRFEELEITIDDMPFRFEGTFSNGLQYLLGQVFTGQSDPLKFNVTAVAEDLDLDELLYIEWPPEEITAAEDASLQDPAGAGLDMTPRGQHFRLLQMFEGTASLTARTFNFREFDAKDVLAEIVFTSGKIRFAPCSATTLDGRISLSGEASVEDDALQIAGDARLRNIDVNKLFTACENFGQETLVAGHLKGTGDADVVFVTWWDTNMVFQPQLLSGTVDLDIQNGELVGFEPMKELSSYVKVKELEDIQFDRLQNKVEIRDEMVLIPTMLIRSTALNLLMTGTHYFDNRIEYYFKINMLDMLARKFRLGSNRPGEMEDLNEGLINLYIAMTGTVDDPVIRTDKKLVKEKLKLEAFDPTQMPYDWRPPEDSLEFIEW